MFSILSHWWMLLRVASVFLTQACWWLSGLSSFPTCVEAASSQLVQISVLYVKLFQAIALNGDCVDASIQDIVLKFTDNPPYSEQEIDLQTLDLLEQRFHIRVLHGPINAGMISLVFVGYDLTQHKKQVIVKLKRLHIDQRLDEAIGHVLYFVQWLDWIPMFRNMQVANVVRKNIHTIRQQTDFAEEVANTQLFRQNFARVKYVRIPEVRSDITEALPNVIVLEYLHGKKLSALSVEDYAPYAKLVLKFSFTTSMMHSLAHGDLHAGNLLFLKDEETQKPVLGVIDFGIVYRLSGAYKQMLYDVFSNLLERSPRETARKMLISNYIEPPGIMLQLPSAQYERILDFTEQLIDECVNRQNGRTQLQMFAFVSQLNEQLKTKEMMQLGVRVSDEFVQTQMMLAMSHGVAHTLTGGNLMSAVNEALEDLFHLSWMFRLDQPEEETVQSDCSHLIDAQ